MTGAHESNLGHFTKSLYIKVDALSVSADGQLYPAVRVADSLARRPSLL